MTWKHKASVWRKGCSLKAEQSRREGEKDEGGEEQRGKSEGNAPGMGGGPTRTPCGGRGDGECWALLQT